MVLLPFFFLDRIREEDLSGMFDCMGKCVEVVVSPRRNKWGKKFDFRRFREDRDVWMLAVRLDSIQIDSLKVHANIPRFELKKEVFKSGVSGGFQGV